MSDEKVNSKSRINEHFKLAVNNRKNYKNMSEVALRLSNAFYYTFRDGDMEREVYEGVDAMITELVMAPPEMHDLW